MLNIQVVLGLLITLIPLFIHNIYVAAFPAIRSFSDLGARCCGTPVFPPSPPSCPICAQNFSSINSCALAAPVLANYSEIIFNPGAFIDVIKCACTDTFQAAYPQCADCFIQTNQTELLNCDTEELPGILQGLRQVCALESVLNANVSVVNNETTPTPSPTPTSSGAEITSTWWGTLIIGWVMVVACMLDFLV